MMMKKKHVYQVLVKYNLMASVRFYSPFVTLVVMDFRFTSPTILNNVYIANLLKPTF